MTEPIDTLAQRRLTIMDVSAALPLSIEAGWNQVAADWTLMVCTGHALGLVDPAGILVATGIAVPFPPGFGRLCMILVTERWRNRGLAKRLTRACWQALARESLVAALDATDAGRRVYLPQGFRDQYTLVRLKADLPVVFPVQPPSGITVGPLPQHDLSALCAWDAVRFGARRDAVLTDFRKRMPTAAIQATDQAGHLRGYALARDGRVASQIGPVVAEDAAVGIAMILAALAALPGPVYIDVPDRHSTVIETLRSIGFVRERCFTRMVHGRAAPFDHPDQIYAIAGPELG